MQKCTYDNLNNEEDMKFELSGNNSLQITECVIEKAGCGEDIYPHWKTNLNGVKNPCSPRSKSLSLNIE